MTWSHSNKINRFDCQQNIKSVVALKNVNIVTNKWIFKTKMHINGSLDKLKARLVARDFSQVCETDYFDIFASTLRFDILRLFMIIVALKDLKYYQIDINNAFIELFLKEKIYIKSSPNVNISFGQVLLIKQSLYGLKQTAKNWHKKCINALLKLGFV